MLPFTVILTLNCLIIRTLRKRKLFFEKEDASSIKEVKSTSSSAIPHDQRKIPLDEAQSNKDKQLVIMLMSITFALLALTLPNYIFVAVFNNIKIDGGTSPFNYALYIFNFHLVTKLFYTNNTINFFLYCLTGTKFRNDAWQIISACK